MILVTGGAGYIGCVLVEELLKKGYAVRVFDKLYFGDQGLAAVRDKIDLVQGDIRDLDPSVIEGIDAVIHLAGLSNDPTAEFNPRANQEMNEIGTANLARICKEAGIRRFTYASSCSIYDRGLLAEDTIMTEESQVEPRAAYAVTKYAGERALLELADDSFCPVILRQGTVYGFSPRMRYDLVVNTFVKSGFITGRLRVDCGGEMWRPLVDVTDVAKVHIACIEGDPARVGGEIFNISYKNFRILELAHWVKKALKGIVDVEINVDYQEKVVRSYRVSNKKISDKLNFRPEISVEESARNMAGKIRQGICSDLYNPLYRNISWMELLVKMEEKLAKLGKVF